MAVTKLTTLALLATSALAIDKAVNPDLNAQLLTAPTELDRLALLPKDSDWTFDFHAQKYYTYSPGGVANANAATFPASVGNGMTMAWLALGPCAMLPPHYHPRASNYVVAVEGETETYMVLENGARRVTEKLTPGKMTIFPKGSLHSMQNTGCGNATLISALNTEDAGTHNIVNGLFNLPPEIVSAAFGGNADFDKNKDAFGKSAPGVGTGAALGSAECLRRCGLSSDERVVKGSGFTNSRIGARPAEAKEAEGFVQVIISWLTGRKDLKE